METVLRIALIYFLLMVSLRALGKRDFSQLSSFEFVTMLLIPEIVSHAMIREDYSMTNAVIGLATLFVLVFLTSTLTHKSRKAGEILEGTPSILVSNGRFVPETMDVERVTPDEVYGEMHKVGLARLEQVQWAILEADGQISFIPFAPEDRQVRPREERVA